MAIRIVLIDDHHLVRQGLKALIEKEPDLQVVGEAENGKEAVELVQQHRPHLVIIDVSLPDNSATEATEQILAGTPDVKVIALSLHSGRHFVISMFQAGASAYLLKDCAFEELAQAIRMVAGGKTYLGAGISDFAVRGFIEEFPNSNQSWLPSLTTREREVLQLMAEGKSTNQIAVCLDITIKTVESHTQNLKQKLGINSVANLTKYALREGLTSLDS